MKKKNMLDLRNIKAYEFSRNVSRYLKFLCFRQKKKFDFDPHLQNSGFEEFWSVACGENLCGVDGEGENGVFGRLMRF